MTQPPLGQSDTQSTLEINDPTTEEFRKRIPVILEETNTIYALIPLLITQKYAENDVRKILIQPLFCASCSFFVFTSLHFFAHTIHIFLFSGGIFT